MKKKALIIGALPSNFEGPWVRIDDHEAWRIVPDHDYGEKVVVELFESDRVFQPNGDPVKGHQARARILADVPDVPHVSIWLEAVNGSV